MIYYGYHHGYHFRRIFWLWALGALHVGFYELVDGMDVFGTFAGRFGLFGAFYRYVAFARCQGIILRALLWVFASLGKVFSAHTVFPAVMALGEYFGVYVDHEFDFDLLFRYFAWVGPYYAAGRSWVGREIAA